MKSRRIHHIDIDFQVEPISHESTKGSAIAVFHPTIRANEPQTSTTRQNRKRPHNEGDIDVCSVIHRLVAATIFCQQCARYQFLTDIGWITNHKIETALQRCKQEI